jgi:riboflavin biosynthesis pyrimidine reductase
MILLKKILVGLGSIGLVSAHALQAETVAKGLAHPWAVAFLPDGRFLVTERPGRMRVVDAKGQVGPPLAGLPEVAARGQGGLLDVVLDSQLRLPLQSRMVTTADNDVMVFCTSSDVDKQQALRAAGVCVEQVAADSIGRVAVGEVVARLGTMEITSLLIEGGSEVNGAALAAGVVDKVFLYYAPRVLGDRAVPWVSGFSGNVVLKNVSLHRFGEDFAVEGYMRDPYE